MSSSQTEDESYEAMMRRERADTEPCPPPHVSLETQLDAVVPGPRVNAPKFIARVARQKLLDSNHGNDMDRAPKTTPRSKPPILTGVLNYFPDALREVARLSQAGNDKHNPGQSLHWSQSKSNDHYNSLVEHLTKVGESDPEWGDAEIDHAASVCWRALAGFQMLLQSRGAPMPKGAK